MQIRHQQTERPTSQRPFRFGLTLFLSAILWLGIAAVGIAEPEPVDANKVTPFSCVADETTLCLNQGRFQVRATWRDFSGQAGVGTVVPFGSDDSGLYWFFVDDNWEMLVKVLDGCAFNDRYWVFATATTDVEYTLEVVDSQNGAIKTYTNDLGNASEAITDTSAFASCP